MNNQRRIVVIGVFWFVVLFACGGTTPKDASVPEPDTDAAVVEQGAEVDAQVPSQPPEPTVPPTSPPPTETVEPTPIPPTATPIAGLVAPGTHIVGEDIQPGIFQGVAGADLLQSCYWARLSGLSGEFDDLVANDNSIGQFYIEVTETDVALETDCPLIALEHAPPPANAAPAVIGPGTYLIGRDIAPGRYRGQGGSDIIDSCYWARLTDVSGSFDALIANDNATGQYFVQVSETDFALKTDCELNYDGP